MAVEVMVRLPTHYQVVALVDNDPAKQGRLVMGLPVLAANALVKVSCDAIYRSDIPTSFGSENKDSRTK